MTQRHTQLTGRMTDRMKRQRKTEWLKKNIEWELPDNRKNYTNRKMKIKLNIEQWIIDEQKKIMTTLEQKIDRTQETTTIKQKQEWLQKTNKQTNK